MKVSEGKQYLSQLARILEESDNDGERIEVRRSCSSMQDNLLQSQDLIDTLVQKLIHITDFYICYGLRTRK